MACAKLELAVTKSPARVPASAERLLEPKTMSPKPEPIEPLVSVPTVASPEADVTPDDSAVEESIGVPLMVKEAPLGMFTVPLAVSEMPPKKVVVPWPVTASTDVVALVAKSEVPVAVVKVNRVENKSVEVAWGAVRREMYASVVVAWVEVAVRTYRESTVEEALERSPTSKVMRPAALSATSLLRKAAPSIESRVPVQSPVAFKVSAPEVSWRPVPVRSEKVSEFRLSRVTVRSVEVPAVARSRVARKSVEVA